MQHWIIQFRKRYTDGGQTFSPSHSNLRITLMAQNKPKRRKSTEEDDAPRTSKKKRPKKSAGGMSTGLLIGLIAGGGAALLVIIVIVISIIFLAKRPGGGAGGTGLFAGNAGKTKTVSLEAGAVYADKIGVEDKKSVRISVESELANPNAEIEITVFIADLAGRQNVLAANKTRGKSCSVNFISPGFGDTPFHVKNHGPGAAKCTITHNGMKNMNWQ